ncbi:hypothetical protein ACTXT7_014740 [Hymenolepis weldensis]
MWFKIHRRKTGGPVSLRPTAVSTATPRKVASKSSKKSVKRFHWPSLRRSASIQRRKTASSNIGALSRPRTALPPPPASSIDPIPRRIRCGTTVIPIMRASALHLPPLPSTPAMALKRRPSTTSPSLEDHLQKISRLNRRGCRHHGIEHFNPVYNDVYSYAASEDEAIYEEIAPPRKRALVIPIENLDLMQVSAMVMEDSSLKQVKSESPAANSTQGIYALHGGDWISIASGIYDDVASSGSETDEEFDPDAEIYGWSAANTSNGTENIPWTTAALGRSIECEEDRWICQDSYILH